MTPKIQSRSRDTKINIGMISLGCPKTLVDSEIILGKLDAQKYAITPSIEKCDVALLNTCSFIQDAQKESVDKILEFIELKKEKKIKNLIVMGCLVQQFTQDLQKQLKEVDAFIGSGEYGRIPEIVENVTGGKKVISVGDPGYLATAAEARIALTPRHYRYLKISEGCDHICSFCTIPTFRGKHRSRTIEDVLLEAERLAAEGAKELIITGQDTTYFGKDQDGKYLLPELIRAMDHVKGLEWFRVMYAYPSCITKDLMEAMASSKKMCRYLDMPLQHASDHMLQSMRRGMTKRRTKDLIREFRETVSDLAIRTTFIVGFPGETEKDFEELLGFIEEMRFDRLGIFTYSEEQASASFQLPNHVPEKIKLKRRDQAMRLQQKISLENNQRLIGKIMPVLIDGRSKIDPHTWLGRSYRDAPEVDGSILLRSKKILPVGTFQTAIITDAKEYDLVAEIH